jgi:hypothetical protein
MANKDREAIGYLCSNCCKPLSYALMRRSDPRRIVISYDVFKAESNRRLVLTNSLCPECRAEYPTDVLVARAGGSSITSYRFVYMMGRYTVVSKVYPAHTGSGYVAGGVKLFHTDVYGRTKSFWTTQESLALTKIEDKLFQVAQHQVQDLLTNVSALWARSHGASYGQ